jgi:hypothetical protein
MLRLLLRAYGRDQPLQGAELHSRRREPCTCCSVPSCQRRAPAAWDRQCVQESAGSCAQGGEVWSITEQGAGTAPSMVQ